jgi:mRNA-degrading endonuclease RelE of RelBE toxin-antitoxin system
MPYQIEFVQQAEEDLDAIRAFDRSAILHAVEHQLSHEPEHVSRARIKRLRGVESPAFRLRAGDYRVFYDVDETVRSVTVLRVLSKEQSLAYLREVSGA